MKTKVTASDFPAEGALATALGASLAFWEQLLKELVRDFRLVRQEWVHSKTPFGGYCIVRSGDRALLYLIPAKSAFEVAIVLGERAAAAAISDPLLRQRKALVSAAPRCAAGRAVRFAVESAADVATARRLVQIKTAPK